MYMFNKFAYLSGIIDSEGCFRFAKESRKKTICYKPCLSIGMTDKSLIEYITTLFPTSIHCSKRQNKLTFYMIRYMSNKTEQILEKVYPFLRVKKDQADIILKVIKIKRNLFGKSRSLEDIYYPLDKKITELKHKSAENFYEILPEIPIFDNIEDEYSYQAGLIDGDGCLHYSEKEYARKDRNNKKYPHTNRAISVMMNNPEGILPLGILFNTKVARRKKVFFIQIKGKQLKVALEALIPYLILKKEKAKLLLDSFSL